MAEAEDKQETIREFNPLSRLIGGTRNNLAKIATKIFLVSFPTYPEPSVHGNPFNPFSIMLLTGPTYPVANRVAKKEFLVELDLWAKMFNEEPVCPEMLCNFYYLMTICGYWCLSRTPGLLQGNGFYD